jgi:putative oxidoreductase
MKKNIFTSKGIWENGIFLVRISIGLLIIKYGLDIFDKEQMNGYNDWLKGLHFPIPLVMAYTGKVVEFIGGICLALGLFTRLVTVLLIVNMIVVTFIMGNGKIFLSDAQLPFLFLLLFFIFFLVGSGKYSLDYVLFDRKKNISYL